jgi:signal transduction histidine kinase
VTIPLLLEVDGAGKILWMSQRARDLLGDPAYLTELVITRRADALRGARFRVFSWHFWRVWEWDGSVVVGARAPQWPDRSIGEFHRLEANLVRRYFKLVDGERRLSERARRHRGSSGGRKAIRQIELERQRLGRELHTGVGQSLAAIRMQLDVINGEMPLPPPKIRQALASIGGLSASALEQVRGVSKRLHPPEWQRLTLEEALRQLWDLSGVGERFSGGLEIEPLPQQPVPEIKALLYRAMQESLSNLVRHSKATEVRASLRAAGDRAVLTVEDNGVGFDVARLRAEPASVKAGIGLRSIRDQVAEAGGNFDMESSPVGTKLVVSVQMTPQE